MAQLSGRVPAWLLWLEGGHDEGTGYARSSGRPSSAAPAPGTNQALSRHQTHPWAGRYRTVASRAKLGVTIAPSRLWEILHAAGIDPAPRREGPTWRQFLHAQATGLIAVDFLHADTALLRRLHVLVFIKHGTRRMHLGGVTANPTGEWTVRQARDLALSLGERFEDIRFVIRGRGSNFTCSNPIFERHTLPLSQALLPFP